MQYGEFHAEGFMLGCLYEIAGYPGAIPSQNPEHLIKGDIFRIINRQRLFTLLDDYEECSQRFACPHEYIRVQRNVTLLDGQQLKSWVYLYNRPVNRLKKIACGDYLEFLGSNHRNASIR